MIKEIKNDSELMQVSGGERRSLVVTSSGSNTSRAAFEERFAAFRARIDAQSIQSESISLASEPRFNTASGATVSPRSTINFNSSSSGANNIRVFSRTSELSLNI